MLQPCPRRSATRPGRRRWRRSAKAGRAQGLREHPRDRHPVPAGQVGRERISSARLSSGPPQLTPTAAGTLIARRAARVSRQAWGWENPPLRQPACPLRAARRHRVTPRLTAHPVPPMSIPIKGSGGHLLLWGSVSHVISYSRRTVNRSRRTCCRRANVV